MPSVALHPPGCKNDRNGSRASLVNPLPQLLQTPSGLALVEIQGTLHTPASNLTSDENDIASIETPVGRLVFPFYNPNSPDFENQSWMKRIYLYVGKHQRLTGEVKKLPKAIAVIRKRESVATEIMELDSKETTAEGEGSLAEQLEIVEIVKYKILFAGRPEPVGD